MSKKLTHEEFIAKLPLDRTYKVIGKYGGMNSQIIVEDEYSQCSMKAHSLVRGAIPSVKTATNRKEYFIKKCEKKFLSRFKYIINDFHNQVDSEITVICPIHGEFSTNALIHFESKKGGCLKCQQNSHFKRYSNYKEDFLEKVKKIHGDRFDYSKSDYLNNHQKITITCKIHGDFKMSPACHLRSQGCKICSRDTMGGYGGYCITNAERFKENWLNKKAKLYIVRLYNKEESFIKIGITVRKNILRRFSGVPYQREVIVSESGNLYDLTYKEQEILYLLKNKLEKPKLKFEGWRECFKEEELENLKTYLK